MNKIIFILATLIIIISLFFCGCKSTPASTTPAVTQTTSATSTPTATQTQTRTTSPNITVTQTPTPTATATTALGPEISFADVPVIAAHLIINAEGENKDGNFEGQLLLGGDYVRTSGVNGYEIFASGKVDSGEMYYSFTLNKDLTTVTSGVISLVAGTGASLEVKFSDIPRNADYENEFYEIQGVNALIFVVKGTAVSSHLSSVKVNEPSAGVFSRFFAVADSEILVVLAAATESQAAEMVGE
jgi:hypothetical protein